MLADDPSLFRYCHDIIQVPSGEFHLQLSDFWGVRVTDEVDKFLRRSGYLPSLLSFFRQRTIEMPAHHVSIVTNLGIQMQLPLRRYPGCPIVLQVVLACRNEGSSGLITVDVVRWRSRCYRYTGEIWSPLLPDSYQRSQLILSYEAIGAPSGVVIEDAVGTAALLRDECVAKTGTRVMGDNEHCFAVTCADAQDILNQPSPILLKVVPYLHFCALLCACVLLTLWGPESLSVAAAGALHIYISKLSANISTTRCSSVESSIPGEYVIGSGTEIVLLRGERRAVSSIIRTETMHRRDALQHLPVLYAIIVLVGLFQEPWVTRIVMWLPFVVMCCAWLQWYHPSILKAVRWPGFLKPGLRGLELRKYTFSTRAGGVVFALFLLQDEKAAKVMDELLPSPNNRAWKKWKTTVLDITKRRGDFDSVIFEWDDGTWTDREKRTLISLFQDALDAHGAFKKHLMVSSSAQRLPVGWAA
ncbi:hypothetical protein EDD15DRAFT_2273988 [Pisolithus albus]|nr:hypothetical protein EDD15DRAFT_2273988 [Pisolithus albus]